MREQNPHRTVLTFGVRQSIPNRNQDIICIELMQKRSANFWIAVHIEQAIAFPMNVSQFGDHIPLDAGMRAHVLDLELERIELQALARFCQCRERGEDAVEVIFAESLLDAAWV